MNKFLTILIIILLSIFLTGCSNGGNQKSTSSTSADTAAVIKSFMDTVSTPGFAPQIDSSVAPKSIEIPDEVGGLAGNGHGKEKGMVEISGLVRYHVPDSMKVGKDYSVDIRISRQKDTTKIVINMPQGKTECIRVGSTMEVKLIDPEVNNFEITALNSEIQTIEDDGDFTSWEWTVKPLNGGTHKLKLLITIKTKDLVKDIPVFNKDIFVHASPFYSLKKLVTDNWAVLLPSVFLPIIGGIWHLFFKKKRKPSDEDDDNY